MMDVITGKVNPSGRLNETYPIRHEDTPAFRNFPSTERNSEYRESLFIGYRYFDTSKVRVQYPFGYGLSYTEFTYSDLKVTEEGAEFTLSNTGKRDGAEVAQMYVAAPKGKIFRPEKELKNFVKVYLEPGQEKAVTMTLDKRSFAWYNTQIHDWYAASGDYQILAAASSRDIRLSRTVRLSTDTKLPFHIHRNTTVAELLADPRTAPVIRSMMEDLASDMIGGGDNSSEAASEAITPEMTLKMLENSPLRSFKSFSGLSENELTALIEKLQAAVGSDN